MLGRGSKPERCSGWIALLISPVLLSTHAANGATTAISHYSFGGLRIAVKRGSALYHVHGDHLGSTSLTTAAAGVGGSRAYYPNGAQRVGNAACGHDVHEAEGGWDGPAVLQCALLRPRAGHIHLAGFAYARANPLKYGDPSRIKAILLIPIHVSAITWIYLKGILSGCGAPGNARPFMPKALLYEPICAQRAGQKRGRSARTVPRSEPGRIQKQDPSPRRCPWLSQEVHLEWW